METRNNDTLATIQSELSQFVSDKINFNPLNLTLSDSIKRLNNLEERFQSICREQNLLDHHLEVSFLKGVMESLKIICNKEVLVIDSFVEKTSKHDLLKEPKTILDNFLEVIKNPQAMQDDLFFAKSAREPLSIQRIQGEEVSSLSLVEAESVTTDILRLAIEADVAIFRQFQQLSTYKDPTSLTLEQNALIAKSKLMSSFITYCYSDFLEQLLYSLCVNYLKKNNDQKIAEQYERVANHTIKVIALGPMALQALLQDKNSNQQDVSVIYESVIAFYIDRLAQVMRFLFDNQSLSARFSPLIKKVFEKIKIVLAYFESIALDDYKSSFTLLSQLIAKLLAFIPDENIVEEHEYTPASMDASMYQEITPLIIERANNWSVFLEMVKTIRSKKEIPLVSRKLDELCLSIINICDRSYFYYFIHFEKMYDKVIKNLKGDKGCAEYKKAHFKFIIELQSNLLELACFFANNPRLHREYSNYTTLPAHCYIDFIFLNHERLLAIDKESREKFLEDISSLDLCIGSIEALTIVNVGVRKNVAEVKKFLKTMNDDKSSENEKNQAAEQGQALCASMSRQEDIHLSMDEYFNTAKLCFDFKKYVKGLNPGNSEVNFEKLNECIEIQKKLLLHLKGLCGSFVFTPMGKDGSLNNRVITLRQMNLFLKSSLCVTAMEMSEKLNIDPRKLEMNFVSQVTKVLKGLIENIDSYNELGCVDNLNRERESLNKVFNRFSTVLGDHVAGVAVGSQKPELSSKKLERRQRGKIRKKGLSKQEKKLKKQAEETRRKEEACKMQAEEARRKEEARKKQAEEARKRQEEARKRQAEEARRKQAEEARKRQAEEDRRKQAEEARKRQAEEDRRKREEARKRQAEEARKKQEEARKGQAEEARKKQEETRKRQAEEARRKQAEEDRKRQEEEARKKQEEDRKRQEEEARKKQEETRKRQEEEARLAEKIKDQQQREQQWREVKKEYRHSGLYEINRQQRRESNLQNSQSQVKESVCKESTQSVIQPPNFFVGYQQHGMFTPPPVIYPILTGDENNQILLANGYPPVAIPEKLKFNVREDRKGQERYFLDKVGIDDLNTSRPLYLELVNGVLVTPHVKYEAQSGPMYLRFEVEQVGKWITVNKLYSSELGLFYFPVKKNEEKLMVQFDIKINPLLPVILLCRKPQQNKTDNDTAAMQVEGESRFKCNK